MHSDCFLAGAMPQSKGGSDEGSSPSLSTLGSRAVESHKRSPSSLQEIDLAHEEEALGFLEEACKPRLFPEHLVMF